MEFWVLILTLWAIVRWLLARHWRKQDKERFERVIAALNRGQAKIEALEKRIHELEEPATPNPVTSATKAPSAAALPAPPTPGEGPTPHSIPPWPSEPREVLVSREQPKPSVTIPPPEPVNAPLAQPATPTTPAPPRLTQPPPSPPPETHRPAASAPPAAPAIAPRLAPPPRFAHTSPREISAEFEQQLGGNWLNKIGITILVIGISLFLAIKFPSLSNPEKVALGYVVSLAILGIGIYLEKRDRYRIFARALIGGGWALTFFTTYAMHFVPYTRVIQTQAIDLVLLLAVAAVMVVHTLRYDSQVVTGLTFLLAFTTVTISQNTIYSLSTGVILALGLVAIVQRRSWFELEIFGVLASYLNHFVWLTRMVIPISGHHHMFPEFVPSCVLLSLYWAVYRWSYVSRRIERDAQETISTLAAILNTSLLLLLLKYQSVRPEWSFYVLLILGAAELAIAQFPSVRHRRPAFIVLSSIGTVLLVAAIPFKFSGLDMAIIWLAEAQILFIAGVAVREQLFRGFGFFVALLTAADMLVNQGISSLLPTLSTEWLALAPPTTLPDYQLALSFVVAAVLFYANAILIPRRWSALLSSEAENVLYRALCYVGAVMLFVGLALAFPHSWTALAWAAAAFALLVLGRSLSFSNLIVQTHLFATSALFRAIVVNSVSGALYSHTGVTLRLITLPLIIALFYLCARWLSRDGNGSDLRFSEFYTTAAALLVMLLAHSECHWAWIGIAWCGFALVLAVLGLYLDRPDLSWQAHVIVLAGFGRTLLFNFHATQEYSHFTIRLITFTLMAALLYLCAYFSGPRDSAYAGLFSALHTFVGSLTLAVLAFLELASPWIAVSWALFAFLLLLIGQRVKRKELHVQAYILSALSLFQLLTVNIAATQPFHLLPAISVRLVTMAIVAMLFYVCARWAATAEFISNADFAGSAYTWTGSFVVLVLLHYELYEPSVALSWVIFGVGLFEFGLFRKLLNWRLQSYATLVVACVRIFLLDFSASPQDLLRYTLPTALLFYYAYARLTLIRGADSDRHSAFEQRYLIAPILAYMGSATLAFFAVGYFQAGPSLIAWATLAFLFIAIAWFTNQDVFLDHSVVLAFLVLLRAFWYEFVTRLPVMAPWFDNRVWSIATACALLFACQAFAFPLRARLAVRNGPNASPSNTPASDITRGSFRFPRRPEQIYFFIPMILVTLLILQEAATARVTIAWGIEAVVLFLFALLVGERSYRLAGLGLLLVCVAKILALDVWRQEPSDRYVTFISLGVALLLVSFLYTRYSETIKRYL